MPVILEILEINHSSHPNKNKLLLISIIYEIYYKYIIRIICQ